MASCGNTHTPTTVNAAASTAHRPSHPVFAPREQLLLPAPPERLLLPAPRPGSQLAHGRARHSTQQLQDTAWAAHQGLEARAEVTVRRSDGTKGRLDHIIFLDRSRESAVITEYKTDRLDRLTPNALSRWIDKTLSQIDGYRFAEQLQLPEGDSVVDVDELRETQSCLHIDERPTTPGYAEEVERRCWDAGVNVIFLDE
jgi:hypothetical protein